MDRILHAFEGCGYDYGNDRRYRSHPAAECQPKHGIAHMSRREML